MLAATTGPVLFFKCAHIARFSGINRPSRNGIFLMKNMSTVRICCTWVTLGAITEPAGIDVSLFVFPLRACIGAGAVQTCKRVYKVVIGL